VLLTSVLSEFQVRLLVVNLVAHPFTFLILLQAMVPWVACLCNWNSAMPKRKKPALGRIQASVEQEL